MQDDPEPKRTPAIPGMLRDEDATILGDAPDEPTEDESDAEDAADSDDGPLGVRDDDTVGIDDQDDRERRRGATEA
ncbi:hypothetical protein GCM10011390_29280 [Aureimonas endophytica]|uniref:Uncharacterized protein n=1 Tax=Aureimonas endophytica TaxID=2027858 RepID=A0A917E634_9HYPH|nr:hypothetical protein [Aureimonas endophytica]GGE08345.1 hypothetical protein GCM10011390_29280 [Aureimonas endophytica]